MKKNTKGTPTRRTSMYMKKKKMWMTTPTIVCSVPITERVSFSATARLRRSLRCEPKGVTCSHTYRVLISNERHFQSAFLQLPIL